MTLDAISVTTMPKYGTLISRADDVFLDEAICVLAERRATLVLTRARAVADLSRATAAPHRRMLEQAIATIDEQLTQLDD